MTDLNTILSKVDKSGKVRYSTMCDGWCDRHRALYTCCDLT